MKNKQVLRRLVSGILAAAVAVSSVMVPTTANDSVDLSELSSNGISIVSPGKDKLPPLEDLGYKDEDEVRVSIVLEDASTIKAGFDIETIAVDSKAIAYRDNLKIKQLDLTKKIENTTKAELDVVHNLTLAANLISANVKFGQIKDIEKVNGVKSVLVETKYDAAKTVDTDGDKPNMSTSSGQIGSAAAWAEGYTGAGSVVAVIDTGIDSDHQSFDADAFMYSLKQNAKKLGVTVDEYVKSLDLLDAAKVEAVADQLNVAIDPAKTYISTKIPFAYNYVDLDYDITHDNDTQGGHGSHVEGIAAANKYVKDSYGDYVSALDNTFVQGVAPDAQIITMKVFGKNGGAYDSDYMLAIEDAIVLGADSINLSLGSANGGTSKHTEAEYQKILDELSKSGAVVAISAGNSGHWADNSYTGGLLYNDDVNSQTNGSPGSYTNAFTVASVENSGLYSPYIIVNGEIVTYNESLVGNDGTPYTNKAFETLKGDHEYVMLIPHYRLDEDGEIEFDEEGNPVIDGLGSEEDWEGLEDIVKGKIAVVSRGTLSFIDKCENAVMAGAVGVIIYNNQPGVIYMDLSDYTQTAPAVTISQYDGALLMNTADEFSEDGTYCTGKLSVHEAAVIKDYIEGDVISDFSSWGVPGSLEMKPEIAAPGGNIYSVDGEWAETDKYVSMSGTSMASPQVAGMAAVAAQYVREKGLEKKTSLSARALIQSLLMSTARPMTDEDGYYYSVLQQGAGLANIGSAVNADSYILMDKDANAGAADGKVKAELGDDPKKTGSYTFGFTLYNLTNTEKKYDLSADFFTQAVVDAGRYSPLYVQAKFTDFLEGTTRFDCGDTAVVPANGSKHVTVTFTLDAEMKEYLNEAYPSGAYIEGYVFAEGQGTDSEVTTAHSIPVLGFYGNWSTASMFDKGSYEDYYLAETEDRMPYLSAAYAEGYEEQSLLANSFGVTYEGGDGPYPLGGNPYIDYLFEEYDPDRNAVNGETSLLSLVQFAPIRNAADSKFIIYNETTKETILETSLGAVSSAYYHTNAGRWYNTALSFAPNYDFAGVKEGDKLTFTFALAPEYYQDAEGNVRWKDVDMTNALSMSVVVDNTKPEIVAEPELEGDTLSLTVKDNQHIAAILLTNKSGSKVYAIAGSDENAKIGEEYKVDINVAGINSDGLYVQVVDYANNITTVKVDEKFGEGTILPNRIAYDCEPFVNYWVAFNGTDVTIDDLVHGYERSDYNINAATIVDHIVFAVDVNNQLITMPDFDFEDVTEVINFSKFFEDPIAVLDMAYNEKDGKIYMLIARAEGYDLGAERYLVAFDKLECIPELVGEVPLDTLTLACDREGSFYSGECGTTNIYKYTLDAVTGSAKPQLVLNMMEQLEMTDEELASGRSSIQSMEWDPNNDILCWTLYSTQIESYYFEIDPETKEVEPSDWLEDQLCALIIPDQSTTPEIPDWAEDAKVTTIFTTAEMSSMYMSTTQKVTAEFLPWTAESAEIEWVSSDEDVLTVDSYGNVTAVGVGTAKIYAYLKGDHSVFDYVEIESEMPQVLLKGALQDVDGSPMLYTWNMSKDLTWTGGAALKGDMSAGTLNKNNGHIYTISSDGTTVREIDPKDGSEVAAYPCTLGASGVTLWDMTYSDMFSDDDRFSVYAIYGSTVLIDYDPTTGEKPMGFDADDMGLFMMTGAEYFVAIANLGEGTIDATREEDEEERILPTERIALLDNLNYLWIFEFFYDEDEDGPYLDFDFRLSESHSINEKYPLAFKYDEVASMVLGDDGYVYLSAVSDDSCNLYQLDVQLWEEYDDYYEQNVKYVDYTAKKMGSSGDKVWPMLLTSAEGTIVTETDEATGITVTYTFIAEGVNLSVKTLDSSDTTVSYDIKLVDADGENVDPDGKVVVEIPVPEGMNAENAAVYVLNEDGTYTKVDAELVDGVFVFTTNKLGVYAVSTEKLDEIQEPDVTTSPEETTTSGDTANDPDNNKPTGIVIAIVPAVVSAAAVMVTKRRNRK